MGNDAGMTQTREKPMVIASDAGILLRFHKKLPRLKSSGTTCVKEFIPKFQNGKWGRPRIYP